VKGEKKMGDPWAVGKGNGFIFKGGIDPNRYDPVFAYTLGDGDWISIKAINLQDLVSESERRSKATNGKSNERKNPLVVSVPLTGGLARWFDLLNDPKTKFDKLRIYIYDNEKRPEVNPNTILVFHNIKKPVKKPATLLGLTMGSFFTFQHYDLEIVGQRA
jgi:hypothetical protein